MKNKKDVIVLGIGNTIRGDDGIGIYILNYLEPKFKEKADFLSTEEMGLSLIDFLSGYKKAIIIDSMLTGKNEAGTVEIFKLSDFNSSNSKSAHYVGLPDLKLFAQRIGIDFPEEIYIIGIEVEDPYVISPEPSDRIRRKMPNILREVEKHIKNLI